MSLNIIERQVLNQYQYEKYIVDTDSLRQKLKQTDNKDRATATEKDAVDISEAGRTALKNKMFASSRAGDSKGIQKLSSISYFSIINDFESKVSAEKKEGVKNNTFDCHVNQMVSAYKQMQDDIEEKYSNINMEQQYYVADDGSIQELTKEKELEMLDKAYERHSQFMATSTKIWSNLQDFKLQITYHSKGTSTATAQPVPEDSTKREDIEKQAYQAFISALNNIKFNSDISTSTRGELNHVWDYYAKSVRDS